MTTYRVTGSLKAVKDLWNTIQTLRQGDILRLDQLAEHYGIDYEAKGISVRGFIYGASLVPEKGLVRFDTETAWNACDELFEAVNEALDWGLSMSYREIEPGMDVFYVHDEGGFFPELCYVSACGGPFGEETEGVYPTVEDAISLWCRLTGIGRGERSEKEMRTFINEYEYSEEDTYFYINRFTYV